MQHKRGQKADERVQSSGARRADCSTGRLSFRGIAETQMEFKVADPVLPVIRTDVQRIYSNALCPNFSRAL